MQSKSRKTVERRTNVERSAETRERILEATLSCLAEHGYAATSTNDVVKRAGLSRGALMHHYPSKSELVAAAAVHLIRKRYASVQKRSHDLADNELSIRTKLELLLRDYEKWFPETIEFMIACRTDKALSEKFNESMQPYEKSMGKSMVDEWPEWSNHQSPLMIQYVLGCFVRGLCLEAIINPQHITEAVFEEFVRIMETYAAHG